MDTVEVNVESKQEAGKRVSASLRRSGKIPAIIYGGGAAQQMVAVNAKDLQKALSGPNGVSVIVDLNDGSTKKSAMLKELQYHPITDKLVHADFQSVDRSKPYRTKLPIELKGEPVGVKIKGGSLRFHHPKLELEGLPELMPVSIPLNVTGLDVSQQITVGDIELPEGVRSLDNSATRVVSIAPPKAGPKGKEETAEAGKKK